MHLSSTWFLRAFTSQMWTFVIFAYFIAFLFFFCSLFVFRRFRKIKETQHSSLSDIFIYMWNFIASQGIESRWTKFLFWKIQMMNISFLQIIVATGFSTFLVTLLSTKYYEMPYKVLEDFERIQTRSVCFEPFSDVGKFMLSQKWWAGPICFIPTSNKDQLQKDQELYELVCDSKDRAYVVRREFPSNFHCLVVKLDNLFPKVDSEVPVHPSFRYKDRFSTFLLRMKTAGIIDRIQRVHETPTIISQRFVEKSTDYKAMTTYNVETEGVMFMQIKYFMIMLGCAIIFAFLVLIFEWIVFGVKKVIEKYSAVQKF